MATLLTSVAGDMQQGSSPRLVADQVPPPREDPHSAVFVAAALPTVLGAIAAFAATRLLKTLLYGVSATDPIAFGSVIAILFVVAVLASYLPARRAARTAPMDVLRAG